MQAATNLKYMNFDFWTIVVSLKFTGARTIIINNEGMFIINESNDENSNVDAINIAIEDIIEQTNRDLK
jgi:hypothetical protein